MKRNLTICLLILCYCQISYAQMGIGTITPDSSAVLDVFSNNKGFLPPRITLTAAYSPDPVHNPATGLLIYNTATAGIDSNKVNPGYYYWNGVRWYPLSQKGNAAGDMLYWNGNRWVSIPAGVTGSVLTMCNGVPRWGNCNDTITIANGPSSGQSIYITYNNMDPGWANGNVYTNQNVYKEVAIATSVNGSATITSRGLISFNLTAIPAGAEIVSAKLSLYGLSSCNTIPQGNQGSNEIYIQRITDNWNQTTVTWNTQPATTTEGQIELPPTTSTFNYDVTGIDVTNLVRAMRTLTPDKTAGFCLRLKTETIWRSVVFSSNRNEDATKRPKLEIIYR